MTNEDSFVSANELSKKVVISQRKIEETLKKLKDKGILIRIGPDKGGHWEIIKATNDQLPVYQFTHLPKK